MMAMMGMMAGFLEPPVGGGLVDVSVFQCESAYLPASIMLVDSIGLSILLVDSIGLSILLVDSIGLPIRF